MVSDRRELEDAMIVYHALTLCCTRTMGSVKNSGAWSDFGKELAKRMAKDRPYDKAFLEDLFDNRVTKVLEEICFIDLVRIFERIIFDSLDNASGEIKAVVKASRGRYPFYASADRFVKSSNIPDEERHKGKHADMTTLGHVQEILTDISPELSKIVKYRNFLAHGNRFKNRIDRASSPGELHQILEILEEALGKIRPLE